MNLEQLRKQAKELLKGARAGDGADVERLGGREPILANAQLALAREQGYSSWPALVAAAEAGVDTFVEAATTGRRERAEAMLEARPEIAGDEWARLVLGRGWEGDPNRPGGPLGWPPLLYASHSVFPTLGIVRGLLRRGADPNSSANLDWGTSTAIYGAAGVRHDPELTRVLLEAGADPNDGESVYHSTEAEDPECLRLLLDAGAETTGTNGLAHALDYDRIDPVRMLLEAGADPNEHPHVAHAIRRGRGPEFVRLLYEFDADLDAPGGETWRPDARLRTPYAHAVLRGRADVARTLEELGASTELPPGDAAVAAISRGERPTEPLPDELDYDAQEALILAALDGKVDLVFDAVGPDFRGVIGGSPVGTLLHHTGWTANADAARELLAAGADPNAPASEDDPQTPLGWAVWGSVNLPDGRDYVSVADALVEGGARVDPGLADAAAGPLREWLELRVPGEL